MDEDEFILILGRMRQALYALEEGDHYDKRLAIQDLNRFLSQYEITKGSKPGEDK